MKLTEARLKEIWREQTTRAAARQAECLTEEQFARAVAGETTSEERARVASHLALCSDCVEEYRILRSLRPLAEQAEAILATSEDAPGIGQNPRAVGGADARPSSFWRRFALVPPARAAFALAALLLISLSLGAWLILLRQGNDREIAQLNRELAERDQALASVRESLDETRKQLEETIRRSEQEKTGGGSKRYE
ncbi:MAG: zf-HC2 domain-containing protein, partial [Blastocatellia bacterium]